MHANEEKARAFRQLHVPGNPLVLVNVWDAGSARAVTDAGAPAIATSSWAVAAAAGLEDGERFPLADAIKNLVRIAGATDLPVSVDVERGYGETNGELAYTIRRTIDAGAIGCNIEDSLPSGRLRDPAAQAERIGWVRRAADEAELSYFINARTDVFFQAPPDHHDSGTVAEALERADAYASAGADGLFVPGLVDLDLVRELASRSPLPVNIMVGDGSPGLGELAGAGVARISYGPVPYLKAMATLRAEVSAHREHSPVPELVG